jgi:hypothetical protein
VRRVRVADGVDLRTFAIDEQVHREFTRCAAVVQRAAFEIRDRQQIFRHAAFARHRRRREYATIVQTHADVAV